MQGEKKEEGRDSGGYQINIVSGKNFNGHAQERWSFQRIEFSCGNPSFEIDAKTGYIVSSEQ